VRLIVGPSGVAPVGEPRNGTLMDCVHVVPSASLPVNATRD